MTSFVFVLAWLAFSVTVGLESGSVFKKYGDIYRRLSKSRMIYQMTNVYDQIFGVVRRAGWSDKAILSQRQYDRVHTRHAQHFLGWINHS